MDLFDRRLDQQIASQPTASNNPRITRCRLPFAVGIRQREQPACLLRAGESVSCQGSLASRAGYRRNSGTEFGQQKPVVDGLTDKLLMAASWT
ncbi:MAG TPA: hypothetical protein VEX68_19745 [Bryobacteraceae bacterium]|nr:hypothetical protein [Bryobacteraceae bacterium]